LTKASNRTASTAINNDLFYNAYNEAKNQGYLTLLDEKTTKQHRQDDYQETNTSNTDFVYGVAGADYGARIQNWYGLLDVMVKDFADNMDKLTDEEKKKYQQQIDSINTTIGTFEAAQAEFKALNEAVNKIAMQAAFYESKVSQWDTIQISNKTLEEAIIEIVNTAEENGDLVGMVARDSSNKITKDARDYAISILRNTQGYEKLFKKESNLLMNLMQTEEKKKILEGKLNVSREEMLEAIDTFDIKTLDAWAEQLGNFNNSGSQLMSYILSLESMTSETENFARALGVSVNDLDKYTELRRVTIEDLSKSVSELTENMDSLDKTVSSIISNGGVSISVLSELISKNPDLLLKYDENMNVIGLDASSKNIFSNVLDSVLGNNKYSTLLANSLLNQVKDSSEIYKKFLEYAKNKNINTDNLEVFSSFTEDAVAAINLQDGGDVLSSFLNGLSSSEYIEYYKSLLDQVSGYETKMIDNTISNLEQQKDAIGKVNEEYKKQIDLIKAQQALENAKNEKKRVYRAGIGWTYEADQEAIKTAMEQVDKTEEDKERENIQYQIDLLEKTKSIIENMPENQELEKQKELFELWGNKLEMGVDNLANFVTSIRIAYESLDKLGNPEESAFSRAVENMKKNEGVIGAANDFLSESGQEKYGENSQTYQALTLPKGDFGEYATSKYNENVDKYNEALGKYQELFSALNMASWESQGIYDTENGTVNITALNKAYGTNLEDSDKTEINKLYKLYTEYGTKKEMVRSPVDAYIYNGHTVYQTKDGEMKYAPDLSATRFENSGDVDVKLGEKIYGMQRSVNDIMVNKEVTDKMQKFLGLFNHQVRKGDIVEYQGIWYTALDSSGGSWAALEKDNSNGSTTDSEFEAFRELGVNPYWDTNTVTNEKTLKSNGKRDDKSGYIQWTPSNSNEAASNKNGTFDFEGGMSMINELGTEGIVTPGGTLTSLPAHTGIVPADLTRNLYDLGEVAPNLIKEFSNNQKIIDKIISGNEDNSTNINTLNANFTTGSDFDFEKLLIQVRQYLSINKNHRM